MSEVDTSLDRDLRAIFLTEVRRYLPGYLSPASVERPGPLDAAIDLLGLPEASLRRVMAVHLILSPSVRLLMKELSNGMRRPLVSSARPRVAGRTITAGIDWAATVRHRATSSPLGGVWVTRPATKVFDIEENRALAWTLHVISERCAIALADTKNTGAEWFNEISGVAESIRRASQMSWLESVPAVWPGDDVFARLAAGRTDFYKNRVSEAARYLRRMTGSPSPQDIVEALSEKYFEPTQDWKLFEIAVLMRVCRSLEGISQQETSLRPFNNSGGRAFASFRVSDSLQVKVWYQVWPPKMGTSELNSSTDYYSMARGSNRPDIVVEIVRDRISVRAVVLELKASSSPSYLSSGFSQLLGYLRDRPALLSRPASGWLVAPVGDSYISRDPEGRALWVVSSDDVGPAVQRMILALGSRPV